MADKTEKSHNINIENDKKAHDQKVVQKEKHITAKEVRHLTVALFVISVILSIVALGLGSQAYLKVHETLEAFELHEEHADIEIKKSNSTNSVIIKKDEVEIVLDAFVEDEIKRNELLQKKFTLDTLNTGIASTINRVVSDNSANALLNSFTNSANDNSSLRIEINGVAGNKYVSLSTASGNSPAPNLILLRNNNAFVGIGTVQPQATLHVNGDILASTLNANKLNIKDSANKSVFTVTQDGKVGIGIEAPTKALQVNGDITADSIVLKAQTDLTNLSCNEEGKIIYSKSSKQVLVCNGASFVNLN